MHIDSTDTYVCVATRIMNLKGSRGSTFAKSKETRAANTNPTRFPTLAE